MGAELVMRDARREFYEAPADELSLFRRAERLAVHKSVYR